MNAYVLSFQGLAGSWECLLDAGAADHEENVRWLEGLTRSPELVWISHAHADHASGLPALCERLGAPDKVLSSTQTKRALPRLFEDVLGRRHRPRAQALADQIEPLPYLKPTSLVPKGQGVAQLVATAYPSGHVLGAASLGLDIGLEGKFLRLLYLSDFCTHDQPGLPGASLPKLPEGQRLDVLIMECALGARGDELDPIDYDEELARLRGFVANGPSLVPVAALGEAAQLYLGLASLKPMVHESLVEPLRAQGVEPELVGGLTPCRLTLKAGGIVLAAGAHLEDESPAKTLCGYLPKPGGQLALINAVAPKSVAAKLLARPGALRVERFLLPNHSPPWALCRTVEVLDPRMVILVHGTKPALQEIKRRLRQQGYKGSIKVPKQGQSLPLDVMLGGLS